MRYLESSVGSVVVTSAKVQRILPYQHKVGEYLFIYLFMTHTLFNFGQWKEMMLHGQMFVFRVLVVQGRDRSEQSSEPMRSIRGGKFLDHLSNY